MKKSFFFSVLILFFLTTYKPKFSLTSNINLKIQKIVIENNRILNSDEITQKLSFLYNKNLFFLNSIQIQETLKNVSFIESFSIKKIYPDKIKFIIVEKKPVAILQNKKERFFISSKGDLIKFKDIDNFKQLPTVFGNGDSFYSLYLDLQNINFKISEIKSFYFFDSGRWDLIMYDGKIIKLPIKDYLSSLENFMYSNNRDNLDNYKIFDYRVKDQLILN